MYVWYVGVAGTGQGEPREKVCRSDAIFMDVLVQMYGAVRAIVHRCVKCVQGICVQPSDMGYVSSCVKVLGACRGHDSCLLWLILANGMNGRPTKSQRV